MRKLYALVTVALLLALAIPALADHGTLTDQGNCPVEGKINATEETQDEINNLVLAEGTHVCVKGGSDDAVLVTADGEQTLQELLGALNQNGQLKDVSHYTIIQQPTTTTTVEETTTTTVEETTTTTVEETTTTTAQETTTTDTVGGTVVTGSTSSTLPFTGPGVAMAPLAILGLALAGTGMTMVRSAKR